MSIKDVLSKLLTTENLIIVIAIAIIFIILIAASIAMWLARRKQREIDDHRNSLDLLEQGRTSPHLRNRPLPIPPPRTTVKDEPRTLVKEQAAQTQSPQPTEQQTTRPAAESTISAGDEKDGSIKSDQGSIAPDIAPITQNKPISGEGSGDSSERTSESSPPPQVDRASPKEDVFSRLARMRKERRKSILEGADRKP